MKTIAHRVFGTLFVIVQLVFALPYTVLIYLMRAFRVVIMNSVLSLENVFDNGISTTDLLVSIQMFDMDELR